MGASSPVPLHEISLFSWSQRRRRLVYTGADVPSADGTSAPVYTSLRRRCDQENSEISCNGTGEDAPTFENVQPGVYFLFVERSSFSAPAPFTVNIEVEVYAPPACLDGIDNDEDGLIDLDASRSMRPSSSLSMPSRQAGGA